MIGALLLAAGFVCVPCDPCVEDGISASPVVTWDHEEPEDNTWFNMYWRYQFESDWNLATEVLPTYGRLRLMRFLGYSGRDWPLATDRVFDADAGCMIEIGVTALNETGESAMVVSDPYCKRYRWDVDEEAFPGDPCTI